MNKNTGKEPIRPRIRVISKIFLWVFFLLIFPAAFLIIYPDADYQLKQIINRLIKNTAGIQGFLLPAVFVAVSLLRKFRKRVPAEILKGIAVFVIVNFLTVFFLNLLKISGYRIILPYLFIVLPSFFYYYLETAADIFWKIFRPAAAAVKTAAFMGMKALRHTGKLISEKTVKTAEKTKGIKNKRKKSIIAAAALLLIFAVYYFSVFVYGKYFVYVADISPKGEVDESIVIRAEFSEKVKLKNGAMEEGGLFEIKPPIEGEYKFLDSKIVEFHPYGKLPPAADYSVKVDVSKFSAAGKKVAGGKKTEFHTPYMKIVDYRFFFTKDIIKDVEKELVGEVNFSFPVDETELRKHLSVKKIIVPDKGGKNEYEADYSLERSELPTRFYIKVKDIKREYQAQSIRIEISEGLKCYECAAGMQKDFVKTMNVPRRTRLKVDKVIPWHAEGSSAVALGFNMPVSADEIKRHVAIIKKASFGKEPEILDYNVETEHRFAMFEADFLPNVRYEISVSKGMKSKTGEELRNDINRTVKVRDLPSKCEFAEAGEILSPGGEMNLAIKVMNLDRIHIRVHRIFKNNLVEYLKGGYRNYYSTGTAIMNRYHDIKGGKINQEITEYLNLSKLYESKFKGLFFVEISGAKSRGNLQKKLVRCTDIGMIAKTDKKDLVVKAVSVTTLRPLSGIKIKLVSKTNQVLKETKTDKNGRAVIKNWRSNSYSDDGSYQYSLHPFILLAEKGEDFSYLKFSEDSLNKYRFDIGGENSYAYNIKGFMTSERGLYRPGEKVNLTSVIRNKDMSLSPGLMLECTVKDPSGGYFYSKKKKTGHQGMNVFEIDIPMSARTGQYNAHLRLSGGTREEIAGTSFKVEEFIPDKINVKVIPAKDEINAGEPLKFKIKANQMFGPPASGNKVQTEVVFDNYIFSSKKYKEYVFSDPERTYARRSERLGSGKLNDIGEKEYEIKIPGNAMPPSGLKADIYTEVYDDGGRPVSGYGSVPIHLYQYYLGVKLKDKRKIYKRGDKITFDIVAVDTEGNTLNLKDIQVIVKRKVWYSMFRQSRWSRYNNYSSSYYNETVLHKTMDINGKAVVETTAELEGEYYIYIGNEKRMRTGLKVNVSGPGFTTYDMTKADKLEISTDKEKYMPGDTAAVIVKTPFDGMLYFTVEREGIIEERYVPVSNNTARLNIRIKDSYMPNVYLSAIAIRKPGHKLLSLPFAAQGIVNLEIDKSSRDLKPVIECAGEVMSTDGINAAVNLGSKGADAAVVLAAVDEGILQIIRFETPDPLGAFYTKKALETQTYTIMKKILTDIKAGKRAIGGGYYEPMRKHLNPVMAKRVESYAKFSGILRADENGRVNYRFDARKFNGKARIMAIAVKDNYFGSAQKFVNVVDPIVITPNLPRFLAVSDEFYMPVRIYNNTGRHGTFTAKAMIKGPVKLEEPEIGDIILENKKESRVLFRGKALKEAGKAEFEFSVSGNSRTMSVERELAVRPAAHLVTKVHSEKLEPGEFFEGEVPEDYISFGRKARVFVSSSKIAMYAPALEYLINYPYGCLEQTVSSVFPMLYFKDLGFTQWMVRSRARNVDAYINEGIKKIRKHMLPGGSLTFWRGGTSRASDWTMLYVSHFLIEARKMGYHVPSDLYNGVLSAAGISASRNVSIKNRGRLDRREHNSEYDPRQYKNNMYKLYLETLAGRPDTKTLDYFESLYGLYLKKNKKASKAMKELAENIEKIKSLQNSETKKAMLKSGLVYKQAKEFIENMGETDKFMLSMSFSQSSNRDAGKMALYEDFKTKYMIRELGGMFNSRVRNLGMYLKALAKAEQKETFRALNAEELLIKNIRGDGSFGNTHETSWALMGLSALNKTQERKGPMHVKISESGRLLANLKQQENIVMRDRSAEWKKLKVENAGESSVYCHLYTEGTPLKKKEKTEYNGLKVYREYYDKNGKKTNLSNVVQGKLIVVSVVVEPEGGKTLDNVVVVDLLPAGFEIENPRLKSRGSLNFNPATSFSTAYQDIRDDRILLFTEKFSRKMVFSYTVRAVTPGKFTIPNIYAEAMYDPEINGETYEPGYLVVVPEKL